MPRPSDQLPADATSLARKVADLERQIRELRASRRLEHATITDGALQIRDADGTLRAVLGVQSDGTAALNVTSGPTPPTPTDPVVAAVPAALSVTWDGLFTNATTAPLDFMRVEVHIGSASDFVPDQTTLRTTFDSTQGGTATVPLSYSTWWVKLRSRSTAGVVSPTSTAVSGTPGGTVTGAVIETSPSGQRIVLNPAAPDPSDQAGSTDTAPALELHSGAASQVTPGIVLADIDTGSPAFPYTAVYAPSLKRDPTYGFPITANLKLISPQLSTRGGSMSMEVNNALNSADQWIGNALLYGYCGDTRTDVSHAELYCENGDQAAGGNGNGLGARSWVKLDGAQVEVRAASTAGDVSLYVTPSGVAVTAPVTKSGETWQNPSYAASWASTGTLNGNSTFRGLQYRRTAEDEVWIIGAAVASSGAGTTIFTLPVGYRPPTNKRAAIPAYFSSGSGTPAAGWAQVTDTGGVAINTGVSGWSLATGTQVWLNGSFPLGNIS